MSEASICELCGEPLPPGEEMFKFHGYSGPCPKSPLTKPMTREVCLGVIEFHSPRVNPGLPERFHAVTEDLRAAGCIVDVWLMDIATVLAAFGYTMRVTTEKPLPKPCYEKLP